MVGTLMIRRFLFALITSWLIAPITIFLAYRLGFASNPALKLVLLTLGISVPFQLLLNEVIAPCMMNNGVGRNELKRIANIVVLIQFLSCLIVLTIINNPKNGLASNLIPSALGAAGSYYSFLVALKFVEMVINGKIDVGFSSLLGAVPGLSTIAIYLGISAARHKLGILFDYGVFSQLVVPSVFQWVVVGRMYSSRHSLPHEQQQKSSSSEINMKLFIINVLGIIVLMVISSQIRETLSFKGGYFGALVLMLLNTTMSLTILISKVVFLGGSGGGQRVIIRVLSVALPVSIFVIWNVWGIKTAFNAIVFILCQLLTIRTISRARLKLIGEQGV
jgi:hypothetical protein